MCRKDRLTAFAEQEGFAVREDSDVVIAEGVPCLVADGTVSACTIKKSFDPETGTPTSCIGGAVHVVHIIPDDKQDGCVYNPDRSKIGRYIDGDGKSWSNISIRKGTPNRPEADCSAKDLIYRYVKQFVGAVYAADHNEPKSLAIQHPFNFPNTHEGRSGLASIQDRIRNQSIAIIGLGGTGAYVLDMIAKTAVGVIHIVDDDCVDWHNLMRAPGAPTGEEICSLMEIKKLGTDCFNKVNYYYSKYASLREGIHAHAVRLDGSSECNHFFREHRIDYAFVCIDQDGNRESPRQDVVYSALSREGIPFVDSGISLSLDRNAVGGAVTTSAYNAGSLAWEAGIPNASLNNKGPGYRNVQLPEVNALAASLAVMEWRRRTGQYVSKPSPFLHKFRLESPNIVTPDDL